MTVWTHARWDRLTPEEQKQLQVKRLRRFLKEQVIPFHPYYRELFRERGLDPDRIRSLADLAQIPFSSKSLIAPTADRADRPLSFVLTPTPETLRAHLPLRRKVALAWQRMTQGADAVKRDLGREYRPVQVFFTTGRTALPTSFLLTPYDLELLHVSGGRIATLAGIDPARDRVVSVFPFAPHLAFWQVQAVSIASGCFMLQTGGGKVMGTDGIVKAIERIKPTAICGIPGYVYHMLRDAVESGCDLSSVRTAFLGGDRMIAGFREKLVELLTSGGARNPSVISVMGFTEGKKCWTECEKGGEQAGLHTYPDLEIFEVVDPKTGAVLGEGETGELVYTYLDGRGSVVLRYRTGDIANGGISYAPCPGCGRSIPRLASNLSRASSVTDFNLTKIKGALVNLTVLADILTSHAQVEEWQLVIRKLNDDPFEVDQLHLAVALAPEANRERTLREISDTIFTAAELRPAAIEVLPRAEILERIGMETRLKENRIVDLRPHGAPQAQATPADTRG